MPLLQSHMAREIAEQPHTVAATIDAVLPLRERLRRLAAGRRHILLIGRGTSDNAAVYGRYLCEIHSGRRATLAAPSLATHYRTEPDLSDTVAVAVSQSGRTAEIVETQAWAGAHGARTVAVTNDPDSPLARQADLALVTAAGTERAVPATKTYTAQLTALAVLADALGPEPGTLLRGLRQVPEQIRAVLTGTSGTEAAAELIAAAPGGQVVVGRGITQTTALELALKLEETCLRPVRGLSYADLRHGPFAVLDERMAAVVVAPPSGPVLSGLTGLVRAVRATGARVVGIGGDTEFAGACSTALHTAALPGEGRPGAGVSEVLAPLPLIVAGQLLAEATARHLGLDPDRPRSLTKVTQTDG